MKTTTISIRVLDDLKSKMDEAKEKQGIDWNAEIRHFIMEKLGLPVATVEKMEELVKSAVESNSRIKRWMLYWYANGFSYDESLDKIMNEHTSALAKTREEAKEAKEFLLEMERAGINKTHVYIEGMSTELSEILRDILEQEKITDEIKKEIEENIRNDEDILHMARILYTDSYPDYRTLTYLVNLLYGEEKGKEVLQKLIGSGVIMHKGYSHSRKHSYNTYRRTSEADDILESIFKEGRKVINKEYIQQIVEHHPFSRDILLWIAGKEGLKPRYENYYANWRKEDKDGKTIIEDPKFSEAMKELVDMEIVTVQRDYEDSSYYSMKIVEHARDGFTEWWIEETS